MEDREDIEETGRTAEVEESGREAMKLGFERFEPAMIWDTVK
jgi:hypothetical protein